MPYHQSCHIVTPQELSELVCEDHPVLANGVLSIILLLYVLHLIMVLLAFSIILLLYCLCSVSFDYCIAYCC